MKILQGFISKDKSSPLKRSDTALKIQGIFLRKYCPKHGKNKKDIPYKYGIDYEYSQKLDLHMKIH